jgi:membrane protein YdbS with pleckstrin-like domain
MKTSFRHLFRKREPARGKAEPAHRPAPAEYLVTAAPSWWMVLFAYLLAGAFLWGSDKFFVWFAPYFQEVFKNLKGLPPAWADLGLYWAERALGTVAVAAALYHHLWKMTTRYRVGTQNLRVESWLPVRRVTLIAFGAIRKVGYHQSPLGFLLNFAHVEIDTGSPLGPVVLLNCPKPKALLAVLQEKVESVLQPHLSQNVNSREPQRDRAPRPGRAGQKGIRFS